jgi:hypothetical protein
VSPVPPLPTVLPAKLPSSPPTLQRSPRGMRFSRSPRLFLTTWERSDTPVVKNALIVSFARTSVSATTLGAIPAFIHRRGDLCASSPCTDAFARLYPMHDTPRHGLGRWLHSRLRHILRSKRESISNRPSTPPRRCGRRQPESWPNQVMVGEP